MNLRTLKKLSKRAAPLLPLLGDDRQQFAAERENCCIGTLIRERKHFERGRSVHADAIRPGEIKIPAKDGNGWVWMAPPSYPRKGTIMVGAMSGYYEPEWDEQTAWEALRWLVHCEFTDWSREDPIPLRALRTPREIFQAAAELIAEQPAKVDARARRAA